MIEQNETFLRVTETADVAAADLFAVLSDPRRHVEIDGSGMLQAADGTPSVTAVGEVFTMDMRDPSLVDYRTDNHVLTLVPGREISWSTARAGQPPVGVHWSWKLDPLGSARTQIVHTYDWSAVTDPTVLARVGFPRVSAEQLEQTVHALVAAAAAREG